MNSTTISPPPVAAAPAPRHRRDGSLMAGVMDPHLNILPTPLTKEEEGNTSMVSGNRTRTYYFRRCKRKRITNIESLPDDLLFDSLVRLPAQDIRNPTILVCRKWYHLIHTHSFIYAHLHHMTSGLLIQCACARQNLTFISMRQCRIEISELSYKFKCVIWASCNGLVLGYRDRNEYSFCIVNPATKQYLNLPPFCRRIMRRTFSGIAYAAASMEYKVVLLYAPERYAILTVGVDNNWRQLCTQHLSPTAKKLFNSTPLITEGFLHWAPNYGTQVLTLNVETEIITETPVPFRQVYGENIEKFYMSTGRYLSLLIACGKFSWEVWEMKPETGEWTKLPNIDLEAQKCRLEQFGCKHDETLIPVGWLKYPEVLVFCTSGRNRTCIFYKVHTHEIDSIELPFPSKSYAYLVHKNSLVSFGGC